MTRLEKLTLLPLLVILLFMGACSNNEWDEIPYPDHIVYRTILSRKRCEELLSERLHGYKVKITNGASLSFDTEYSWTFIDGGGVRLPKSSSTIAPARTLQLSSGHRAAGRCLCDESRQDIL